MLLIYLTYTANTNIFQMFFIGWPTNSKKKQSTIILDLSELAVIDTEDQTGSDTYEDVSAEEVEHSRKNSDQATIEMMKAVRDSNKAFAFLARGMGSKAEKERALALIANVSFRAAELSAMVKRHQQS